MTTSYTCYIMKTIIIAFFLILNLSCYGQNLIYKNQEYWVSEANNLNLPLPDTNLRIVPSNFNSGYSFEIANDSLFLKNVDEILIYDRLKPDSSFQNVNRYLNLNIVEGKLFTDWINDTIIIDYGSKLPFHRLGGYERHYKNYFEFTKRIIVKNGIIKHVESFENEESANAISLFDSTVMDKIVAVINKNVEWSHLALDSMEKADWFLDLLVLKLSANGQVEIKVYDEKGIKDGAYSCGECKEDIIRQKEIDRTISSMKFRRIKRFGKLLDIEIIFDIQYELNKKIILNPYRE
jgi:hypothetical protein